MWTSRERACLLGPFPVEANYAKPIIYTALLPAVGALGYLNRLHPEERIRLNEFRADKYWLEWKSTLNPRNNSYESSLFMLLGKLGLNPTELIQRASSDNGGTKELGKQIKIVFAQLTSQYTAGARNVTLAALRSFLRLNEIELPLIGLRIQRFPTIKPFLSWSDAERIISKTNPEYRDCYTVMLWGGLDDQRFVDLNVNPDAIADVKKQLGNEAAQWIKIDIAKGRKQSPPYYVIVPRKVASLLPILRANGEPVASRQRLIVHWNTGLHRAGFTHKRFGPHNLRSAFKSEATRRGLNPVISEFQLGHRPDPLNYQRLNQDLKWVIGEFEKAWETQPLVTESALGERDLKIEKLEGDIAALKGIIDGMVHQRLLEEEVRKARNSKE